MNPTAILVIDVESNGLYGDPFCVGAVVCAPDGKILDRFFGKIGFRTRIDAWAAKNLVPILGPLPVTHQNIARLEAAFLDWFYAALAKYNAMAFADWRHPVDCGFLANAQRNRPGAPAVVIHECSTVLMAAGVDSNINRADYVAEELKGRSPVKHHPEWDAEVSARATQKAMRVLRERHADAANYAAAREAATQAAIKLHVAARQKAQDMLDLLDVVTPPEPEKANQSTDAGRGSGDSSAGDLASLQHVATNGATSGTDSATHTAKSTDN